MNIDGIYIPNLLPRPIDPRIVFYNGVKCPRKFEAFILLTDSFGKRANKSNWDQFPIWAVNLTIEVTPKSPHIIGIEIFGSTKLNEQLRSLIDYSDYSKPIPKLKSLNQLKLNPILPKHSKFVSSNYLYLTKWSLGQFLALHTLVENINQKGKPRFRKTKLDKDQAINFVKEMKIDSSEYLDDEFYRNFAKEYLEAVYLNINPNPHLAKIFHKSIKRIQYYSNQCRKLGYIPQTTRGKTPVLSEKEYQNYLAKLNRLGSNQKKKGKND